VSWQSHAQATGTAAAAKAVKEAVFVAVSSKRGSQDMAKRGNVPVRTSVPVRRRTKDGAKEEREATEDAAVEATEDAAVVMDQDAGKEGKGKGKDRDQVKVPLMTLR